jgi:hypothetical protein
VDRSTNVIYEMSKGGFLVNVIDLSAASPNHPADVVLAPGSSDPGRMNLYLVTRGVDNDSYPDENDGMLYEMSVDLPPVGNLGPLADAGPNQAVTLPSQVTLAGSTSDDGLPNPPGTLTNTWTQISGPGAATFADASSPTTTVSFSAAGIYVLRLTADDSIQQATDDMSVAVAAPGTTNVQRPVAVSKDDGEEAAGGAVNLGSGDLELVNDGNRSNQTVDAVHGVTVPQRRWSATRTCSSRPTERPRCHLAPRPGPGRGQPGHVHHGLEHPRRGREPTQGVLGAVPADRRAAGADQRTPNLAPVIQEIVNRPGWASGNSMVIIITGTGKRAAESYSGGAPPVLHIGYGSAGENQAPVVSAGSDQQLTLPDALTVTGTASDDGLPDPPAALTTTWSLLSGPQSVEIADPSSLSTTVTFFEAGTYVLRLTADDGAAQTVDDVTVTVSPASSNLVGNPGFEVDTAGWNTSGSVTGVTLTRVSGGNSGLWSALLTNGSTTSGRCLLNDSPNWVTTTSAGSYTGSLWVRADASVATLNIRFREYDGGTQVGTPTIAQIQLTTAWQLVTVTRTPQAPGTSSLDFTAYIGTAPPGTCFYADDVTITRS